MVFRNPALVVKRLAGWRPWRTAPRRSRVMIGVGLLTAAVLAVAVAVGAVSAGLIVKVWPEQGSMFDDAKP
jgi:hypothetical protein